MKKIFLIIMILVTFSSFAEEKVSAIRIENNHLVIDLNLIKIEDILLKDGTVIDAQKIEKLNSKLTNFKKIERAKSGTSSGGE